jgi:hypothetical protein
MGLLSRKPKIGIEEFCRQFYDSQIFHPIIAGLDASEVFLETIFNSVVEADRSFSVVDPAIFRHEMISLWMELFGLAWIHQLSNDKYTCPQAVFTKNYLEQKEKLDIWKTMGEYNEMVAKSSVEIVTGERSQRAWIVYTNTVRHNKCGKLIDIGMDAECAARVCNRLATEKPWRKGITSQMLVARLANRLDCDENVNFEVLFRLQSVAYGFYSGAKDSIESVNLQVSIPNKRV